MPTWRVQSSKVIGVDSVFWCLIFANIFRWNPINKNSENILSIGTVFGWISIKYLSKGQFLILLQIITFQWQQRICVLMHIYFVWTVRLFSLPPLYSMSLRREIEIGCKNQYHIHFLLFIKVFWSLHDCYYPNNNC